MHNSSTICWPYVSFSYIISRVDSIQKPYPLLPLFQNISHLRFTKICFDHKYLSNTISKNYKKYTVGFVLKNTIIILFLKNLYQHKLRVINGQSSTSNIVRTLYCETEGVLFIGSI